MKTNWNRRIHPAKTQPVDGSPETATATPTAQKPPRPERQTGYENSELKPGAPGRGYETR
jgi:hypothetical protein